MILVCALIGRTSNKASQLLYIGKRGDHQSLRGGGSTELADPTSNCATPSYKKTKFSMQFGSVDKVPPV